MYPTPPLRPELNPSSPFYSTLMSCIPFVQGKGMPRNVVLNMLPRGTPGPYGNQYGPSPRWIANDFALAAAPDGNSQGYGLHIAPGSKSLAWPYGGDSAYSAHSDWDGHSVTYFMVLRVDNLSMTNYGNSGFQLIGSLPCYSNSGSSLYPHVGDGPGIYVGDESNGALKGKAWFAFLEGGYGPYPFYISSIAPIVQAHEYAIAVAMTNVGGTGPGGGNLAQARRLYIHDLTTNTRICGNKTDHQNYYFQYGPLGNDQGYSMAGALASNNSTQFDLVLNPGNWSNALGQLGSDGHYSARVLGMDGQFWDDSGWFFNVPSAFGAIDPFSTFVANIYGMINSTYVTGSSVPTVVYAGTSNSWQYAGQSNFVAGSATAGVPTTLPHVAVGDATLTYVDNTTIEITVTRPQAGPAAITSYSLYGSTASGAVAIGSGTLLATNAVGGTTIAETFRYQPGDTLIRDFVVTATDGTNTYTYPQVQGCCCNHPTMRMFLFGDSYETATGGMPHLLLMEAGAANSLQCQAFAFGHDGDTISQWQIGDSSTVGRVPFYPSQNAQQALIATMNAEYVANGSIPFDICFFWLTENDSGTPTNTWTTLAQALCTAILATGQVSRIVPVPFSQRLNSDPQGTVFRLNAAIASICNGTTILNLVTDFPKYMADQGWAMYGGHPSKAESPVWAQIAMRDTINVIYPSASGGGSTNGISILGKELIMPIPWSASAVDGTLAGLPTPGLVGPGKTQLGDLIDNTNKDLTQVTYTIAGQSGQPFDPSLVFVGAMVDIDGTSVEDPSNYLDQKTVPAPIQFPSGFRDGIQPGVLFSVTSPGYKLATVKSHFDVLAQYASGFRLAVVNRSGVPIIVTIKYKQG